MTAPAYRRVRTDAGGSAAGVRHRGPLARTGRGGELRGPAPRSAGFTLLELMVATVMLGILAAVAFPVYRGYRERAAASALQADLRTLNNAQELHFAEHDAYTDDLGRLQFDPGEDVGVELRVAGDGAAGGWSGRLTHGELEVRCAYYTGAASPYAPATEEGRTACDEGG